MKFGVPVHVSPLMPKDTALFVQNGEIVSKLHRLVTDSEEERIATAVAAERTRVVREIERRMSEAKPTITMEAYRTLRDLRDWLSGADAVTVDRTLGRAGT